MVLIVCNFRKFVYILKPQITNLKIYKISELLTKKQKGGVLNRYVQHGKKIYRQGCYHNNRLDGDFTFDLCFLQLFHPPLNLRSRVAVKQPNTLHYT